MRKSFKNEEKIEIIQNQYKLNKSKNEIKHYTFYSILIVLSFFIGFYFGHKNHNKNKKDEESCYNNIKKNEDRYFTKKLSNFTWYSQCLEDLILLSVFYDVENGFYIDIGANDPNAFSVTKNLYIKGWYGINIEPLPDKYQALTKFRNRDINLQIGVGKIKGNATFYMRGFMSTLQNNNKKKNIKSLTINADTMTNICRQYVPKNEIIQFCKIDVEGGEKDVLLGYDFENYRPKVFCIESKLPGTEIPCHNLWEDILLKNDYLFAYQYRINRFYIDNRVKGLRERFFQADKSIEAYKKLKKHK